MNKTISLAAISMFAVIMGLGVVAPALAVPNANSSADTVVCHFFAVYETDDEGNLVLDDEGNPILIPELSAWGLLYVNNQGAVNGHEKHGDMVWDPDAETLESFEETCLAQNEA